MRVIDGPLIPMMKDDEGKVIPKPKAQYEEVDYRMLAKNAKAKCIREVLEDVPCEGEYLGDPTVEQRSVVRVNLDSSCEGESMGDPSVEPSSSIGIHIN
ncbi:hypothetical protein H5410_032311 [Solanum commersonii]|uniref:Uncharacterized protein n=1 Tax=Solanum commersonii TaxID=4109 RepID=A0A9J5YLU4_SOLCO|nr:hypothetical protein H5410_032311 [Solanum commersonii]